MTNRRMTASELKYQHEQHNPNSNFFNRESMKFFGDTMANYYVPAKTVLVETYTDGAHQCYELQRRNKTPKGASNSAYFDVCTFKKVISKRD